MKKLKLIVISLLILYPVLSKAQGFDELVLQMSQTYPGGTARMMGLGGSKVSLGADVGNIYMNPASLGFFNRSEWVFTPSFDYSQTSTSYLGNYSPDNKLNFNFANIGLVFNRSKGIQSEDKWRGGSFAFTLNRINSYHHDAIYQAHNISGDIIDYAVEQDNYFGTNDITDLLYNVGVTGEFFVEDTGQEFIEFNGTEYPVEGLEKRDGNIYFTDRNIYDLETGELAIPTEDFPVLQREVYESRGSEYAASVSYGGNYNDQIYFGAGLNVMTIDKEINRIYTEQPTGADLSLLTFTDNYILTGSGVNVSLGIIARPIQSVLLGLSYTSPTYYGMEQTREYNMVADYTTETLDDGVIYAPFAYNLTIPSKIRGGITYFFGKSGFISADVETSNTANSKFKPNYIDDYQFEEENAFNKELKQTIKAGVGGEYRMDIFRFRGGISYISDPSSAEGIDYDRMMYGIGAGIRERNFFVDIAFNYIDSQHSISPYPTAELADMEKTNSMTTLSVGFNF